MNQSKKRTLTLATMILSIGLVCGAQVVKAADGDINTEGGILLKDTNANGQIDEAHVTVDYAVATANAISHATDEATTIGKFTVTDAGTGNPVTIGSVAFVSGDGTIAVFKLVLDEADEDLSINTSGTALDVSYDAVDFDLKITDGSTLVNVAAIASSVAEKDGAQPIILTAVDQNGNSLDDGTNISADANIIITFSEPMDTETLDANDEWSVSPDPESWSEPVWSNDDKTLTLEQTVNFNLGDTETVTLNAPLAISGVTAEDKELQDNSFSFTITEDITPPNDAIDGPAEPNYHSGVTLYRVPNDPRVYVIKNKKKHWIHTPKEFEANGYKWNEIQEISAELLEEYPDAEDLVTELLRAIGDYKVYKLEKGKKHWIKTAGEFNAAGYNWGDVEGVPAQDLNDYPDSDSEDV